MQTSLVTRSLQKEGCIEKNSALFAKQKMQTSLVTRSFLRKEEWPIGE